MSLKDLLTPNGKVRFGAFNKPPGANVPLIGQPPKQLLDPPFWVDFGITSVQPPTPAEGDTPARGYVLTLMGRKTPKAPGLRGEQGGVTIEIGTSFTIQQIIETFAQALNYLNTFRQCGCFPGHLCELHRPPDEPTIVTP